MRPQTRKVQRSPNHSDELIFISGALPRPAGRLLPLAATTTTLQRSPSQPGKGSQPRNVLPRVRNDDIYVTLRFARRTWSAYKQANLRPGFSRANIETDTARRRRQTEADQARSSLILGRFRAASQPTSSTKRSAARRSRLFRAVRFC